MNVATEAQQLAVAEGEGSVAIAAPVRGAMIVTGHNNTVEMRLTGIGAVLAFAFRWNRPRRRRRRDRRHGCPPCFDNHVDREEQVAALLPIDGSPRVVNVYGAAGIGKTHVLVQALNRGESAMRHGTVYLDGRDQSADDLLHAVFDELYECRVQRRDLRIERLLSSRRAVLALEDIDLAHDGAQRLVLGAPRCRFLVTSGSRVLFDATPVSLAGLAPEYAAVIAEQELGRLLEAHERGVVESITARLEGHPLALRQTFSRVRDERGRRPLDEAAPWLLPTPTAADRLATMTPEQLHTARALAVHGDASLGDEHLHAIAGAGAVAAAAELEARHDATAHSPRHSLVGVLAQTLPQDDLAEETDRALVHFTGWAEAHAGDSETLLREAGALLALLERAHAAQRWPEVVRLGRAIESAYALGQRWAAWGRVLELVLEAARRCEDLEAQGWARHQLGTRSYGLGRLDDARASLQEALAVRERLGDRAGAAVTRQNLRVVSGPAPLLYRLSHLSLAVVAIICALLIGATGVAGAEILGGGGDSLAELTIGVQGDGVVVSGDGSIRCADPECREELAPLRELLLRPQSQRGWEFAGWTGACSGRSACRLTLTDGARVIALFKRVRQQREVTVKIRGEGTVVSHPAGITCQGSDTCLATFTRSRRIKLTAAAARGHRFAGWSGDCEGTRCVISGEGRHTVVQARFVADPDAVTLTVAVRGDGIGRVISRQSGIDCGELCTASYPSGSGVLLTAVAQPGSRFSGWKDPACAPLASGYTCTIALDHTRDVIARFERLHKAPRPPSPTPLPPAPPSPPPPPPVSHDLTVKITGPGTVSSEPDGLTACAERCSAVFREGQSVVLTAAESEGSRFAGWGEGCEVTRNRPNTCTVTLDRSQTVQARFERQPSSTTPAPTTYRLTTHVEGSPGGAIQPNCSRGCEYPAHKTVTLTAIEGPSAYILSWKGCDVDESRLRCTVVMEGDRDVRAIFILG